MGMFGLIIIIAGMISMVFILSYGVAKRSQTPGITYTDGVHELCERFKCWWLLDLVVSYQIEKKFKQEEFQTWTLVVRKDNSWSVYADDGNGNDLVRQNGEYTDFEMEEAVLWLSHGVIMLPSEY